MGYVLYQHGSETCLSDLQEQGVRELLPFSTGTLAETDGSSAEGCVMPGCAGCQRTPVPSSGPTPLFHIQRRYRVEWNGLALSVEMDSTQWVLCVRDEARDKTL
jgi:hypothetical protein